MTVRDVAADFGYKPPTSSTGEVISSSIVGAAGTYLAANSFDSGPYGAALTELTAGDQILTVGAQSFFVESGAGQGLKLCIDWVTAPVGTGTIRAQLFTSAAPDLAPLESALVMIDFGALPVAMFPQGYRQIQQLPRSASWKRFLSLQVITTGAMTQGAYVSWLGLDVDSVELGGVAGFPIK